MSETDEAPTTGIVLLHGKRREPSDFASLARALRQRGFTVELPETPWSARRLYDRRPQEASEEFALVLGRLQRQGLPRIVIGGHSSGAAGALRYAASHRVAGLVLIAPAPVVEGARFQARVSPQLSRARALIDAGQGDIVQAFDDFNSIGESLRVQMTPKRFVEYNAPDGPAAMSGAAPAVGSIPVLWIAPSDDPGNEDFQRFIVPRLPHGATLTQVPIPGGHMEAPSAATQPVLDWLASR